MFRQEYPRLYELRDLIEDPNTPDAYRFNIFDATANKEENYFRTIEKRLHGLDTEAWTFLKEEARIYLTKRDKGRGWHQLFDILNQAHGYNFLRDMGCTNIQFIPKKTNETPDLQAELKGHKVLCEVKTINISDQEVSQRKKQEARLVMYQLESASFRKLNSVLEKAKHQMESYYGGSNVKRIAFVVINFDDHPFSEYKERYYQQIDQYLADHKIPGIDIVFYNQKTAFHKPISMKSATLINEQPCSEM